MTVRLIQTQAEFDGLIEGFRSEPLLAVDTEAASFHRYHDRVYLLQLSSRTATAVVDPLAVGDMSAFGAVLADPAVEIVFHDADYDLRLLDHQYGLRARNIFDTRIAAQFLNEPGIGLAALLEKYLGVRLDKRFQRADWSARPLSGEMLEYAAADTRYLLALRDLLRERLAQLGRLAWVEEEFRLLEEIRWTVPQDDEPGFLKMKGAKALKGRALAVLRELYEWRETQARRADKAAFRILNNEPMLAMAKSPPTGPGDLKQVRGMGPDQIERRGRDILAAVRRGLDVPESKLPKVVRPPRRQPDPAFDERLERLKAVRNRLAAAHDLAPGVLCPNGTLEAIARANPGTLEELAAIPGVRRWQIEAIGRELLGEVKDQ